MVHKGAERWKPRWTLRDTVAAIALFLATASVVLWQNAHVVVLFDASYILNTATRIALGQVPYRDFPLAHAPLTFLIQAAIIRLTGRVFFHSVLYVAAVGGLGTVFTWRVALELLRERVAEAWPIALLISVPLSALGIYCIVPNPEYDCDCAFWIVIAFWMLLRCRTHRNAKYGFATGIAITLPLFFKQNMGLPFLLAAIGAVLLVLASKWRLGGPAQRQAHESIALLSIVAGTGVALSAAMLVLHWTAGIRRYFCWTILYAGERRLPKLSVMLDIYRDPTLMWMLPCIGIALVLLTTRFGKSLRLQIVAFALLAVPFLFLLASLSIYDDADERADSLLALWPLLLIIAAVLGLTNLFTMRRKQELPALLPLILLAAINGTFLSQQLWGSTYAIWPLLVLLLAELFAWLAKAISCQISARWLLPGLAALASAALLVSGGFYIDSEERLSYVQLPEGPPAHSAYPQLAGMSTPGQYLPEIDEVLHYAQTKIPFTDRMLLIPGEEPFYFATGRIAQFPVPFFDPTIDPYSPSETALLVQSCDIHWLIVKRHLQTKEDPTPNRAATMDLLTREFTQAAHLRGYDVYHR